MRFHVIWLDADGLALYAEHFECDNFPKAKRIIGAKINREDSVEMDVCGFLLAYADSDFIRRYDRSPGTKKKVRTERIESELATANFPHLAKDQQRI